MRVTVAGVDIDQLREVDVVERVAVALAHGVGGRIVTPNVDILRLARCDPGVRVHLADATLVVPDGAPVVWVSRLAGTPLPERVTGADLIWSLSRRVARDRRSVYLLGGRPADGATASGAWRAAKALVDACPGLRIAGAASPERGFDRHPVRWSQVCADLIEAKPDLVFVGLGFPRQEEVITRLRPDLPGAWFLGCGAAINFVAGDSVRAPRWMRRSGLEWLWRLAEEPRRLGRRYLRHDVPYALRLLAATGAGRLRRELCRGRVAAGDVERRGAPRGERR